MNSQELQFILKMRDEASAIIRQHGQAMRGAGQGAQDLKNKGDQATKTLKDMAAQAKDAATAIGGVWASIKTGLATTEAFQTQELGLAKIGAVAGMSRDELKTFSAEFKELNRNLALIPTDQLLEMEQTLSQMGVANGDLAKVGDTVAKLGSATGIASDQVAESSARITSLTGESIDTIKQFGDALTFLDAKANTTSAAILETAKNIAQGTTQFNMTSDAVLALATSAANAGINPELMRSASQRALMELYKGSVNATQGFKNFLTVTQMTKKEFDDMLAQHPEEVLLRFAEAYGKVVPTGKSEDFLKSLGLNSQEIQTVFGVLQTKTTEARGYLDDLKKSMDAGNLDRRYGDLAKTQANDAAALAKAWNEVKVAIGDAVSPLVSPALKIAANVLRSMADDFNAMPSPIRAAIGSAILLGPAILSAGAAVRSLKALLLGSSGLASSILGARAAMVTAGTAAGGAAGTAAGVAAATRLQKALSVAKFAVKVLVYYELAKEAGKAIGGLIDQNASKGTVQKLVDFRDNTWVGNRIRDAGNWMGIETPQQKAKREAAERKKSGGKPGTSTPGQPKPVDSPLGFDPNDILGGDSKSGGGGGSSAADKIKAAREAMAALTQEYARQREDAMALTAEDKLHLEITRARLDYEKEHGKLSDKQVESLRTQITLAAQAKTDMAFEERSRALDYELTSTKALSAVDRDRLEVTKAMVEFQRENGKLSEEQAKSLADKMMAIRQAARFESLKGQLDPIGTASKQLRDDLATLHAEMGNMAPQEYTRMLGMLLENAREAVDPVGAMVAHLREEVRLAGLTGIERDKEARSTTMLNDLRRKGVTITQELVAAVKEYSEAMSEADFKGSTGIQGWINAVGTFREGLGQLQGDAVQSLSDGITGALLGEKDAMRNALQGLAREGVQFGVNQLLKGGLGAIFGNPQQKELDRANGALGKIDAIAGQTLQTAMATVNAQTVTLTGAGIADLLGAGKGGALSGGIQLPDLSQGLLAPANDNLQQQLPQGAAKVDELGTAIEGLQGPISNVTSGLGGLGGTLSGLLNSLLGGGGGGGAGSLISSGLKLAGVFHSGGEPGNPIDGHRLVSAHMFRNAPRHHTGLGTSEYAAILKRGERVLTANDNSRTKSMLTSMAAQLEQQRAAAVSGGQGGPRAVTQNISMNVKAADANSFNRSRGQIAAQMSGELARQARRNG